MYGRRDENLAVYEAFTRRDARAAQERAAEILRRRERAEAAQRIRRMERQIFTLTLIASVLGAVVTFGIGCLIGFALLPF